MNRTHWISLLAGAVALTLPLWLSLEGLSLGGHIALGIFLMAAIFWITEPIPIYATSLLVIALQALLLSSEGILVALSETPPIDPVPYTRFIGTLANPIIILFLGGFLLAAAAVRYELERNLTRIFLRPFGDSPRNILLGMMLVTALLSAFMSNTATTAMMMTVVLPLIRQLPDGDRFRVGLALCIPIAANIGGIMTPIGTPPNAIVIAALAERGHSIPFGVWMALTAPFVLLLMGIVWFALLRFFPCAQKSIQLDLTGRFQRSPKAIALYLIFGATVILWITEAWHGLSSSLVALLPIAGLTACRVVDKPEIRGLPWEVLWLVAGGISLGISMRDTGLAAWMIGGVPWGALGAIGLFVVFGLVSVVFSNFLSNTVTATLVIPLAIGLSLSGGLPGDLVLLEIGLMIAVACSLGMALPISTPPNAIAYSTGLVQTKDLAKMGIFIGAVGIVLALVAALLYWPLILNTLIG